MRRIVLASHGRLAEGMLDSLGMIAGCQEGVQALCAYTDDVPDLKAALSELVGGLAEGDELVIVTDVLGGSVNNEASQFRDVPGVYIVTGMNLGFVLSLVLGDAPTTTQLIEECLVTARSQLMRVAPSEDEEEDDF